MSWTDRIGRRIKLSDLHVFLSVAQHGSMAGAAQQLNVSSPVVSRAIAQLEHALGVQLMERSARGIRLTEAGRALRMRSEGAFDELRQGVREISALNDPHAGEVRIGTTPTLAASFVAAVLQRVNRRYPRILVHVDVGDAHAHLDALRQREFDFLIHREIEEESPAPLVFERLFQSPYVIVAGAGNPLTRRRKISLRELIDHPWVLPPRDIRFGRYVASAFKAMGLPYPNAMVVTSALEMRANLLRSGPYLSAVPEFWLRFPHPHRDIRKLRVELPEAGDPIGVTGLRDRRRSPASAAFVEQTREVARLVSTTVTS